MGRALSIFVIALMALSFAACLRRGDRLTEERCQVPVGPSDSRQVLERKAASVRPSGRQIAWQELEFEAFVHSGLNTFADREWGTGQEDPALWDRHEPVYGDSPRYNEFLKNQLSELLTGYGEISEVRFDGACGEGPNGKIQVYGRPGSDF